MRVPGMRTVAAAVALLVAAAPVAVGSGPTRSDPPPRPTPTPRHSSDGVAGPVARDVTGSEYFRLDTGRVTTESRRVVPGVRYERWDELTPRGPVVGHVLRVNLRADGVRLEYASMPTSRGRAPLTDVLSRRATAVAGVNGDFFDISDTGAPLGAAVSGGRALGGPRDGWVQSLSVVGTRNADVRLTRVRARVAKRPGVRISGVNIPNVPPDGIGLYTPRWGLAAGPSVVNDASPTRVHQVVVRQGRVVSSSSTLTSGHRVAGRLLVGRGEGAEQLRRLRVGARARITIGVVPVRVGGRRVVPRMAVGGNLRLVQGGDVVATDDVELHPRTAVGIDRDTATLLLVVVDGRSAESRGHTVLELATLMDDLGAESALNLDGGGSSTLVARGETGDLDVENSPSDGQQRSVPNGIAVTYRGAR